VGDGPTLFLGSRDDWDRYREFILNEMERSARAAYWQQLEEDISQPRLDPRIHERWPRVVRRWEGKHR
jgi:hypothetical protein